jgi:hypothetical protein
MGAGATAGAVATLTRAAVVTAGVEREATPRAAVIAGVEAKATLGGVVMVDSRISAAAVTMAIVAVGAISEIDSVTVTAITALRMPMDIPTHRVTVIRPATMMPGVAGFHIPAVPRLIFTE